MPVLRFEEYSPQIGVGTYIAATATIIGNVTIGENCYIGSGAIIRGDFGKVQIGDATSIQENTVVHAQFDEETIIGSYVTVAQNCVLHTCSVDNYAVIGIGGIVTDHAQLYEWAILGENGLVRRGQKILEGEIAVGSPAKVIASVFDRPELKEKLLHFKHEYVKLARRYLQENATELLHNK